MLRSLSLSLLLACTGPTDPPEPGEDTDGSEDTAELKDSDSSPDIVPPIWDTDLVATLVTDAAITVAWTPPADAVDQTLTVDGRTTSLAGNASTYTLETLAPSSEHHFALLATDIAGNVTPEGPELTVTTACLPPVYETLLASAPHLESASVGALDADTSARLCQVVRELETTGEVASAEPQASVDCVEPDYCPTIVLTAEETSAILAAKVGHALWLDVHEHVPWRLADYDAGELAGLFDASVLMTNGSSFRHVVDHSPSRAYGYLLDQQLIAADVEATMARVFDDLRSTDTRTSFIHGIGSRDPTSTAVTLMDALETWEDIGVPARISRAGCHSMSRIALGLLRSANIPGVERHSGQWYPNGHSTPEWPAVALVLPHGDDLYGATLRATPGTELATPFAFHSDAANTAVCGSDTSCLSRRHRALLATEYPAQWTERRCCDPTTYGYGSCSDYLTNDYGTLLTTAEIEAASTSITAVCP